MLVRMAKKVEQAAPYNELLSHAAAATQQHADRTSLLSFADHLEESEHANDPWVLALRKSLNGDTSDLFDLVGAGPLLATRFDSIQDQTTGKYGMFGMIPWGKHDPLSPEYRMDFKTGQWYRDQPGRRGGAVARRPYIVRQVKPIHATQAMKEIFDKGGIGEVIHAVVGAHYFSPDDPMKIEENLKHYRRPKRYAVVGGNTPTVSINLPVPAPAPMPRRASSQSEDLKSPQVATQAPPQPIPQAAPPSLQPAPAAPMMPGMEPPTPTAFILPWRPESEGQLPRRQLRRTGSPRKYMETGEALLKAIRSNPEDKTAQAVYADWLEENAPHMATPQVLDRLRNYRGPLWVGTSKKGKALAIPTASKELLEQMAAKSPWGVPSGEFYHISSRNSKGQAHRVRISGKIKTWKTRPGEFRVPWKFGLYDNGEITHHNAKEWLTEDPTGEPDESPIEPQQMRRLPRKQLKR